MKLQESQKGRLTEISSQSALKDTCAEQHRVSCEILGRQIYGSKIKGIPDGQSERLLAGGPGAQAAICKLMTDVKSLQA